ncbi:predicted protein [Histoplasma mississippiense (nom. inval.)]|uniref:predicted protein n=1 Tax=Ajellomyces capsulatus (strain NAm1 / WU24) TaxID=2059318 RepID=UPI000157B3A2|nr:predicted protein [Histoplasma mississippiense (nom. inval.)]EDN02724.1 predicted protein [Histoplasma mississippiense (nom. inval.)]
MIINGKQLWKYEEIVFPRTPRKQKLRIVKGFQTHENTAAMARDEVNDLPVLKIADVGVALGTGSDIAIEAADTIRFDPFSAIAKQINMGAWSLSSGEIAVDVITSVFEHLELAFSFDNPVLQRKKDVLAHGIPFRAV